MPILILVKIRFYLDPATGLPYIYNHGVDEDEVGDVVSSPDEDRPGRAGSRVAIGQTPDGRFLRVIYVRDPDPDSIFVITAYDLGKKALAAHRRRKGRNRDEADQVSRGLERNQYSQSAGALRIAD